MLHAQNVRVSIGGRRLIDKLDVQVPSGSITAIIGPNGAGKSTLLRGLCGLHPVDGTIEVGGIALHDLAPEHRARALAFLPQQTPVAAGLRVDDVVMLGRRPHRSRFAAPSKLDHDRVHASLTRVGLDGLSNRSVHTLSGGERQRVMLARMLATEAPTMLLDEPTAALDVRHALDLLETLASLASDGAAIVLALHDLTMADTYADQIVCIGGDGAVAVGPPRSLLTTERLRQVFRVAFERNAEGRLQLELPDRGR